MGSNALAADGKYDSNTEIAGGLMYHTANLAWH